MEISDIIKKYNMEYHVQEGMLFKNVYTSNFKTNSNFPMGTAIIGVYCDNPKSASAFHKLEHDEIWHFYGGDDFNLYLLHPSGKCEIVVMGVGKQLVHIIHAGTWQAAEMANGGRYSIFGCTMTPGYHDSIFEMGKSDILINKYPQYKDIILRLNS